MRGRLWLVVGVLVGIALAAGAVPYLAGAARSLSDDAQRVVGSAGAHLVRALGGVGAPGRVVLGLTAVVAVLVPGVTAWLLVLAARGVRRLRVVVAVVLALIGIAAFFYQPAGNALGALVLALAVAGAAVALSGPLVVAPLAALAGPIGAEFLPRLLVGPAAIPDAPVSQLHQAVFASPGSPWWLRVVLVVVAAVPFALGVRAVARA